jgi:hypothetical protein
MSKVAATTGRSDRAGGVRLHRRERSPDRLPDREVGRGAGDDHLAGEVDAGAEGEGPSSDQLEGPGAGESISPATAQDHYEMYLSALRRALRYIS